MSITILLIIAPYWKQSRCPSMVKETGRYRHTTDYYLAIKRNKLDTCNNLEEFPETYAK